MTDRQEPPSNLRGRGEVIRDAIMLIILVFWAGYGALSVFQIFRDGSKVLETLPPFWFWGIPLAPFSALYAPWGTAIRTIAGGGPPPPPDTPPGPPTGGTP